MRRDKQTLADASMRRGKQTLVDATSTDYTKPPSLLLPHKKFKKNRCASRKRLLSTKSFFIVAGIFTLIRHHQGQQHQQAEDAIEEDRNAKRQRTKSGKLELKLPRVLAIVFPQFHQDSLNDKLWGANFTDWDSLRKAPEKNRYGLILPRPLEIEQDGGLGYYDYTQKEPRTRHGELAKMYGIDGFVFHHYWFYDRTHPGPDLHAPLMQLLRDGQPDVPFCLHWCASKWSATWNSETINIPKDGVLQLQNFPQKDDDPAIEEHYRWLRQFFHHPNYIKVDGQPVLMMYQKKPGSFRVLKQFRRLAMNDGFPGLYITVGLTKSFDQLVPEGKDLGQKIRNVPGGVGKTHSIFNKTLAYPNPYDWLVNRTWKVPQWCFQGHTVPDVDHIPEIAGILTSFDNTPRRKFNEAYIWSASKDPNDKVSLFKTNLMAAVYYETCCVPHEETVTKMDDDDRFIIINSMNEWAEGMALEPSNVYGSKFLEAIRDVKELVRQSGCQQYPK